MNIIAWNYRGAGGPRKRLFLDRLLRSTRASIAFVSETKCSPTKSNFFLSQLPFPNYSFVPARGRSGGLWLLWDQNVNLQVISKSRFIMHARVTQPGGNQWSLVGVYGDAAHTRNEDIWNEIKAIVRTEVNVCVLGDFNAITGDGEKWGDNSASNRNNRTFRDFIFESQLIDLGFKGPAYTWTNKQSASSAIFERLDRVLVTPLEPIFPQRLCKPPPTNT